jgi:hypothetical protein
VKQRTSKNYSSFRLCCQTLSKTWDLKLKVVHWLYRGIERPMLIYVANVWWSTVGLAMVRTELCRLKRLACISMGL